MLPPSSGSLLFFIYLYLNLSSFDTLLYFLAVSSPFGIPKRGTENRKTLDSEYTCACILSVWRWSLSPTACP